MKTQLFPHKLRYLLILLSCCLSSSAFAQGWPECPPGPPTDIPPLTAPWGGCGSDVTMVSFLGCNGEICYCYRAYVDATGRTVYEYTITAIYVPIWCNGGTIDCDVIHTFGQLMDDNPVPFPAPPCSDAGGTVRWRISVPTCWSKVADPLHNTYNYTPCSPHDYCQQDFDVCTDAFGVKTYTLVNVALAGPPVTCSPSCTTSPCP